MWPHRRQPARFCHPWDYPGKNTGVGCHFLLQCMNVKSEVAQLCLTLSDPMDCSPPGPSIYGIFPGKSTAAVCHCLPYCSSFQADDDCCPMHHTCLFWVSLTSQWENHLFTRLSPLQEGSLFKDRNQKEILLLCLGCDWGYVCAYTHSVMSDSCDLMDCSSPGSFVHGDFPGKNTGVGGHALFQGIFPTQGSNPGLPHCW